jgi:hypothetical protein
MNMQRAVPVVVVLAVVSLGVAAGVPRLRSLTSEWSGRSSTDPQRTVVLLVHGMTWTNKQPVDVWGSYAGRAPGRSEWNGMIGYLEEQAGYRFGGVIRATGAEIRLPDHLDPAGVRAAPHQADLFALEFSSSANVDGLSYKTAELANCVRVLRQYTGAARIKLVAYSAGGLVCRTWMQSALPEPKYEAGSVDRLITIATPHLGAAIATKLGDLLGTRATSLKPEAPLIQRLNNELDLPHDVYYASIVVRGIAADVLGEGRAYQNLTDSGILSQLPVSYHQGGDQVTHVVSQNLRLAACAQRFEAATGRPVHGILVRVPDPSPDDFSPFEATVHVAAPRDAAVQAWVARLLADDNRHWTGLTQAERLEAGEHHAGQTAFACIEWQALQRNRLHEVYQVDIDTLELTAEADGQQHWRYVGRAHSQGRVVLQRWKQRTPVTGTIEQTTDPYGRLTASQTTAVSGAN